MKKLFTFILLIVFTRAFIQNAEAQQTYQRFIGDTGRFHKNVLNHINVFKREAGYFVAAEQQTKENGQMRYNLFITSFDENQQLIWVKKFGDTVLGLNQYSYLPYHFSKPLIRADRKTNSIFVVCSIFWGTTNKPSSILLLRLNKNGNLVWSKEIKDPAGQKNMQANDFIFDGDSTILIAGNTNLLDSFGDALLVKVNKESGSVESMRIKGNINTSEKFSTLIAAKDSGYLAAGYSQYSCGGQNFLVKYDKYGNQQWESSITDNPYCVISEIISVVQTYDSGYFYLNSQGYMIKVDKLGNPKWIKYPTDNLTPYYMREGRVVENKDSSYTIHAINDAGKNFLLNIDKNGTGKWATTSFYSFAYAENLFKTDDSGYLVMDANLLSLLPVKNSKGLYIKKYNSSGNSCDATDVPITISTVSSVGWRFSDLKNLPVTIVSTISSNDYPLSNLRVPPTVNTLTCSPQLFASVAESEKGSGNIVNTVNSLQAHIYPNPVAGNYLNLFIQSPDTSEIIVAVYTLQGKVVIAETLNIFQGAVKKGINISSLSQGIYFIKIAAGADQKILKFIK